MRYGWVLKSTAEPCELMPTTPKFALAVVWLAFGTATYKKEIADGKSGQVVSSTIAAGAAETERLELLMFRKFARAPEPGISTAQAPFKGGFCGVITPETVVKFSVMLKKPVSAVVKVPLITPVGTCAV